jgi:hypothetical protein
MDEDDGDVNAIERQVETVDKLLEAQSSSWSRPSLFLLIMRFPTNGGRLPLPGSRMEIESGCWMPREERYRIAKTNYFFLAFLAAFFFAGTFPSSVGYAIWIFKYE